MMIVAKNDEQGNNPCNVWCIFFPPPVVCFKISVICSVISDFFVNFPPESLCYKISRSIKFECKSASCNLVRCT